MARASRVSLQTRKNFRRAGRRIARLASRMEGETGETVRRIGEEIMTDVKASREGKGVPVDEGTLRSTGQVIGPDAADTVRLVFGGPAAPYAVVQHERLDFQHDKGEARYLVRGVERWDPDGSAAIRALRENALSGIVAARAGA